jgi:uncharacterized linocin/CFP29 family protein
MTANHLHRELAPVTEEAWEQIDAEARARLTTFLAARKLVDFTGPLGWAHSAHNLGRVTPLRGGPAGGVDAAARRVQPLVELRASFSLDRTELEAVDRGAADPDLDPVVDAARRMAHAEDNLVFNGFAEGGVAGITEATPHAAIPMPDDFDRFPTSVAQAIGVLREAGVGGPYAIALGPGPYTALTETAFGGYPVLNHVQLLLEGPVVWAPAVECAIVLSVRGGDFELISGQDLAVGYDRHDEASVSLYLEESLTFRAVTPEAAVAIVAGAQPGRRARKRS